MRHQPDVGQKNLMQNVQTLEGCNNHCRRKRHAKSCMPTRAIPSGYLYFIWKFPGIGSMSCKFTTALWMQWAMIQLNIFPCFTFYILINREIRDKSKLQNLFLAPKHKI